MIVFTIWLRLQTTYFPVELLSNELESWAFFDYSEFCLSIPAVLCFDVYAKKWLIFSIGLTRNFQFCIYLYVLEVNFLQQFERENLIIGLFNFSARLNFISSELLRVKAPETFNKGNKEAPIVYQLLVLPSKSFPIDFQWNNFKIGGLSIIFLSFIWKRTLKMRQNWHWCNKNSPMYCTLCF